MEPQVKIISNVYVFRLRLTLTDLSRNNKAFFSRFKRSLLLVVIGWFLFMFSVDLVSRWLWLTTNFLRMYQLFSCNPIIVQLSRTVILSRPHAVLINIHLELAFSFLFSIDARNDGSHFCQKLESRGIAVVPLLVVASRKICMPTNLTIYCTEITQKPAASIINMRRQKGSSNVVESSHINIRANYTSYGRLGFKPAENKKSIYDI